MSIRRPFIIGALLLVACVLVWFTVVIVESRVENTVREHLEKAGATCGNLRYRLVSDELVLEDVAWGMERPDAREELNIRRIEIVNPNRAAFDASTPDRPLVAERIAAWDVRRSYFEGEVQDSDMQWIIAVIRIEGWRQNLGRLMEAWRTHPRSESFFSALLDYSADSFTYTDVRGTFIRDGVKTEGGAEYVAVKDMEEGVLSCQVENFFFSGGTPSIQGNIARIAVTDLQLPSPALLAGFVEALSVSDNGIIASGKTGYALEADVMARLESLARDYVLGGSYGHIHLGNMAFSVPNPETGEPKNLLSATRIDCSLSPDIPRSFEFAVEGLFIPDAMAQIVRDTELPNLGVADLYLDADMKIAVPGDQDMAMLAFDTALRDLGVVTGKMWLKIPHESSVESVVSDPEAWLMQASLGKGTFSYTDNGLVSRLLRAGAARTGMTREAFLAFYRQRISSSLRGVPVTGLDKAVMTMLEKPGTLEFQISPRQPVSVITFFMAVLFDPEFMGIQVSATPGSKSILDFQ